MTKERKIQVLAGLDGWLYIKAYTYHYDYMGESGQFEQLQGRHPYKLGELQTLPNYLFSYDAIIPLVVKWCNSNHDGWKRFSLILVSGHLRITWQLVKYFFEFTPDQLSDALIKAAGLWEE